MDDETYDGIVEYQKTNSLPKFVVNDKDRNMRFHFKTKCRRFGLVDGHLVYCVKTTALSSTRERFVLRASEVEPVLAVVHNQIGHLGMKRTQAAVYHSFYWRNIRQDVQKFVSNCKLCNEKKVSGKKVLKSFVNVLQRPVLDVRVRPDVLKGVHRFMISLRDDIDRNLHITTLVPYTFSSKADKNSAEHTDLPSSARASTSNALTTSTCHMRWMPYGHSLDGFHEIHGLLHNNKNKDHESSSCVAGRWFRELDTCRKHRPRKRLAAKQAEMAHTSAYPSTSIKADSLLRNEKSSLLINGSDYATNHELYDGLAARYVSVTDKWRHACDKMVMAVGKNDNDQQASSQQPRVTEDVLNEYWYLSPTFED